MGAISVSYLLARGLSITDIGLIKTIQALTILVGEYPTGILADIFGHKKSLLLALISTFFGFLLFAFGDSLAAFIFAEILTALSLCFWSGAYEAFAIERGNLAEEHGLMDRFFHMNQGLNSLSSLTFGVIGGFAINVSANLPYLLGGGFFLLALFLTLSIPFSADRYGKSLRLIDSLKEHIKNSFSLGFFNPALFPLFLITILVQFSIQPLLHLWQPLFSSFNATAIGLHSVVYGSYTLAIAAAGFISVYCSKHSWFSSNKTLALLFVFVCTCYTAFSFSNDWLIALVLFSLLQGVLSTSRTMIGIKINNNISHDFRASILSSLSLFSRFGMLFSLQWIQILSKNGTNEVVGIFKYFSLTSILFFILFIFGFLIFKKKGR